MIVTYKNIEFILWLTENVLIFKASKEFHKGFHKGSVEYYMILDMLWKG